MRYLLKNDAIQVNIQRLLAGTESKALAASLRAALMPSIILTANPRTLIQLVVQSLTPSPSVPRSSTSSVMRSNPSLTAALINASSLALLNTASFPMRGVVCSAAIGRIRDSKTLIVDPSDEELSTLEGGGVFAFIFSDALRDDSSTNDASSQSNGQLVWSQWNAVSFTEDEFVLASALAQEAAKKILNVFKQAIGNSANGVKIFEEQRGGVKRELPSTQARLSDAMDVA